MGHFLFFMYLPITFMIQTFHLSFYLFLSLTFLMSACKSTKPSQQSTKPNKETALRKALVTEAKKHLGVKYSYGGSSPSGFDCSGFTHYVYKKQDITLSRSSSEQSKLGKEIPISSAKAGDLLFFGRNGRKGKIQHVGMVFAHYKEVLQMIHASSSKGISIVDVNTSSYWKPKLLFCKRIL